jgi:hypothetical protein
VQNGVVHSGGSLGTGVQPGQLLAATTAANETAKVLAHEARTLVAAWKDRLCNGDKMEQALADEEALAKGAAAAALSSARNMATLAKAEAYGATDCLEQARAVIDAATR